MNEFCNNCGMCCKLIPVKNGDNVLVRDGFQVIDENFQSYLIKLELNEAQQIDMEYTERVLNIFPDVEFYRCKYINDDKCTINRNHPLCNEFPCSPLAIVPQECGYLGEIFIKNDKSRRISITS